MPQRDAPPIGGTKLGRALEPRTEQDLADTMLDAGDSQPRTVDPTATALFETPTRYADRRVLGAGGMGEVRLTSDLWIGRDVAMKVVRSGAGSAADARGRFLREARLQGQLEHPSVVPVYDLGRTPAGEAFFTMKRVGGHTLERILVGLVEGDREMTAAYTRRRLLSAMSQVCLAVAYAHSRGVVHRDLKPANVMLGDFGEVYVLDWGVAKIAGAAEVTGDAISGDKDGVKTRAGAIVGTPGYMSPEQARGEVEGVGPASDVYALGAMLFEAILLEPLHTGTSPHALVASSQRPMDPPSRRKPAADVPPELDAICARATALAPEDRYPSARALHEAIERYLDGERDAERRRQLSSAHVEKARQALARASAGGPDAEKHRAEGVRELGRAVALDPTDEGTLRTISELVLSPAGTLPEEARAELVTVELRDRAAASRRAWPVYLAWLSLVPVSFVMGLRSGTALALLAALSLGSAVYAWWMGQGHAEPKYMRIALWLNAALIGVSTTLFGPFVAAPGVAATTVAALVVAIRATALTRAVALGSAVAAIFVPAALQWLHVLPPSYSIEHGVIVIHPFLMEFPPHMTLPTLAVVTLLQMVMPSVLVGRAVQALIEAERSNFAQAWRLRQLLPPAPATPA
jgi:serine/threonine protein kinase